MTMTSARRLRVFISSPGDVEGERRRAALVVARLSREFARFFEIEPVFWEYEVMLAQGHFQDAILPPSRTDVFVCILWSRLGTPLPVDRYRGLDGRVPVTGTEWEFEDALRGARTEGIPDLLVFKRQGLGEVRFDDREYESQLLSAAEQKKALEAFWARYFETPTDFKAAFKRFSDLDEFERLLEDDLRTHLRRKLAERSRKGSISAPVITWHEGSPFRGLHSFEERHAKIFFGRAQAQKQVVEQLIRRAEAGCAFTLVLGASGVGKSSLVAAGVIPDLTTAGVVRGVDLWRRVTFRPRDGERDLFVGLAHVLMRQSDALPELTAGDVSAEELGLQLRESPAGVALPIRMALRSAADGARAALAKPRPEARLLIVIDQLEELFTLESVGTKDRLRFATMLAALARTGIVWIVATMRSDFYHRLAEVPDLVELTRGDGADSREYHLAPPSTAEVDQMVRLPAAAAGIDYEIDQDRGVGLDAELSQALQSNAGALPLLEFVLDELYRLDIEEAGGQSLTFASYELLKRLEGAIAHRAENVCDSFPDEAVAAVLRALVTVREEDDTVTARVVCREELGPDPDRCLVVDALDAGRLLVAGRDKSGRPTVRVAHEALITHWQRMASVIAANRQFLRVRVRLERATADWMNDGERPDRLLPDGIPLAEGAEALERRKDDLSSVVVRYIEASKAEVLRRRNADEMARRERLEEKAQSEKLLLAAKVDAAMRVKRRTQAALLVVVAVLAMFGLQWYRATRESSLKERALAEASKAQQAQALALSASEIERGAALLDRGDERTGLAWLAKATRTAPENPSAKVKLIEVLTRWQWPRVTVGTDLREVITHGSVMMGISESGEDSRRVELWRLSDGISIEVPQLSEPVADAALDLTGSRVIYARGDEVTILSVSPEVHADLSSRMDGKVCLVAFAGADAWAVSDDGQVRRWRNGAEVAENRLSGKDISLCPVRHASGENGVLAFRTSGGIVVAQGDGRHGIKMTQIKTSDEASFDLAPDGALLVTVADGIVQTWSTLDAKPLGRSIMAIGAAPGSGGRIAVVSGDGSVAISRPGRGDDAVPPIRLRRHAFDPKAVRFSWDGKGLVTSDDYGRVYVWEGYDEGGREPMYELPSVGHLDDVAFTDDPLTLVTVAKGSATLWNMRPRAISTRSLPIGSASDIPSIRFSSDGATISASVGGGARRWIGASGERIDAGDVAPSRSQTGSSEAVVEGQDVVVRDREANTEKWRVSFGDGILAVRLNGVGSRVLVAHGSSISEVGIREGGTYVRTLGAIDGQIEDLMWSADENEAIVETVDGATVLSTERAAVIASVSCPGDGTVTSWSAVTEQFVCYDGDQIRWLSTSGDSGIIEDPAGDDDGWLQEIGIVRDGRWLLVRSGSKWDPTTRLVPMAKGLGGVPELPEGARMLAVAERGDLAVVSVDDDEGNEAVLWDLGRGQAVSGIMKHPYQIDCAAFSHDGHRVAISAGVSVYLWDAKVNLGQSIGEPVELPWKGWSIKFSADDRLIAVASAYGAGAKFYPAYVVLYDAPVVVGAAMEPLASLAEALAGVKVNDSGGITRIVDAEQVLRRIGSDPEGEFVSWFFGDPWRRPVAPGASLTVWQYIESKLRLGEYDDAVRRFGGHPLLLQYPRSTMVRKFKPLGAFEREALPHLEGVVKDLVEPGESSKFVKAASVDLSETGAGALLAVNAHPGLCGSGGCTYPVIVFELASGVWRQIGGGDCGSETVVLTTKARDGYRDFLCGETRFVWNGKRYSVEVDDGDESDGDGDESDGDAG